MVDLSINIITWNCKAFLHRCLEGIFNKVEGINFEVIVVDNNSQDGTKEMIREKFHRVFLIENKTNRGVARARNQSIRVSNGRYILLLDADTEIVSSNFNDLISYMDRNRQVGILGCLMVDADDKLYPSARTFPKPLHIIARRLNHYGLLGDSNVLKKHYLEYHNSLNPIEVDYVIGAFQLIRKESIGDVGLLDEKMFYGFEDADYCARMKKKGLKVVFYPSFKIKHHVQGIAKKSLINKMLFYQIESYIRFYIKYKFCN